MNATEWIALTSVVLGIGATVFTQVWQSRQEVRRQTAARFDRRDERLGAETLGLYSSFLTTTGVIRTNMEIRLQERSYVERDDAGTPLNLYPGKASEDALDAAIYDQLPNLLSRIALVAPQEVADASRKHGKAITWAWFTLGVQGADAQAHPEWKEPLEWWEGAHEAVHLSWMAREHTLSVMKSDLRTGLDPVSAVFGPR